MANRKPNMITNNFLLDISSNPDSNSAAWKTMWVLESGSQGWVTVCKANIFLRSLQETRENSNEATCFITCQKELPPSSPTAIYSPNITAWKNGIFQWIFFPSKVIAFTKPPSFSLKMDLDNLEFGVSGFFFSLFNFLFLFRKRPILV